MRDLISVKENKKYALIEILYSKNSPLKIQWLSENINSSIRTTNTYINELREQITEIDGEILSSNEGIIMLLPPQVGIDYFQRTIIKQSIGFRLLEMIFFKKNYLSSSIEKDLFISRSSLNRLVQRLKKLLKDYGIDLNINPFKFIGDEFLIRKFFTKYFLEAYSEMEWPFDARNKFYIDKLVTSFTNSSKMKNNVLNYHKIRIFLIVNLIREEMGFSIYESSLFKDKQKLPNSDDEELVILWLKNLNIPPSFIKKYSNLFSAIYLFYSGTYLDVEEGLEPNKEQVLEIVKSLNYLENTFSLPTTDHTHLVYKLNELLYLSAHYESKIGLNNYLVFKPRDYSLVDIYKQSYPLFYSVAENEMVKLCIGRGLDTNKMNIEEMMYFLISKWEQLAASLYTNFSECKILIYSHINKEHAENIKSMLDSKLERSLSISVFEDPFLDKNLLRKYHFDLLVTTSTLFLTLDCPVVYMPIKADEISLSPMKKLINTIKTNHKFEANRSIEQNLDLKIQYTNYLF